MDDVAIRAYQSSMYFLFVSVLWWTIKLATWLVLVLPALLLNTHQRHKLRQSIWKWDCIIIRYYKSQQILHLCTMKVIHNLTVTSLASASAQKLNSRMCSRNTRTLRKFHSQVRVRVLGLNSWVRTCIKSVPYVYVQNSLLLTMHSFSK